MRISELLLEQPRASETHAPPPSVTQEAESRLTNNAGTAPDGNGAKAPRSATCRAFPWSRRGARPGISDIAPTGSRVVQVAKEDGWSLMGVVACTLFEGDYHQGVGALANSLIAHGYRGIFHVGYRGTLPPWSPWPGATGDRDLQVTPEFVIRFAEQTTARHLAAHKPAFVDSLLDAYPEAEGAVYLDPDIVLDCRWSIIEAWLLCGVPICEDLRSPLHPTHPARVAWKRILTEMGLSVCRETELYANSGFVGASRANRSFLALFAHVVEELERLTGLPMVLNRISDGVARPAGWQPSETTLIAQDLPTGPWQRFSDQIAFNMAIMCTREPISVVGPIAMALVPSPWSFLPHAIGPDKPWRGCFIWAALLGRPPTIAARAYWRYAHGPIAVHSPLRRLQRWVDLILGMVIGRFIPRR